MSLCWRNPTTFLFLGISVLIHDLNGACFFLFQVRVKFIESGYLHLLNLLKVRNVICLVEMLLTYVFFKDVIYELLRPS
jgi:hypothetical protein